MFLKIIRSVLKTDGSDKTRWIYRSCESGGIFPAEKLSPDWRGEHSLTAEAGKLCENTRSVVGG